MRTKIERVVLALLLVATLLPVFNLMQGSDSTVANAADMQEATALSEESSLPKQARSGSGSTTDGKEELVYALLSSGGLAREVYVVNHFQLEGIGKLEDYGAYSAVKNLSSSDALNNDANAVSSPNLGAGDFYYEGTLASVDLPWNITITYTLEGKPITPAQLAGASGNLLITIQTEQNKKVDPTFYNNYLLQIQVSLDSEKAHNIIASDATIASAGANKQAVFTVMPGKEGKLTIQATVSDFEMAGIQVSGLPFSMAFDVPDTSTITNEAATLADAIGQLNEGVAKLDEGAGELHSGATKLASGSAELETGLSTLSKNSESMTAASQQIDGALARIAEQLVAEQIDPAQLEQLIGGLRQLAVGLNSSDPAQPGLYEGLLQMQGGLNLATASMDGYVFALPTLASADLGQLGAEAAASLSPASQATLNQLLASYQASQYVKGAWYGPSGTDGVKSGIDDIAASLGQSAGSCQYMAAQLTLAADGLAYSLGDLTELSVLAGFMNELANNYHNFNTGLVGYTGGVDALAANYASFHYGLSQLANGVNSFKAGSSELSDGTNELYINVEDLPKTIQSQVDEFLKDYQKSDFEPVSFVSPANTQVSLVQFILLTDPIEKEIIKTPAEIAAPVEESFLDKLLALFA